MNLIDAIKSGKPWRRSTWDQGRWRAPPSDPKNGYSERWEDIIADDWEILEPVVTVTRTEYWEAVYRAMTKCPIVMNSDHLINKIAIELGFEDIK